MRYKMRYKNLSILSEEHFRRLTGIRNSTFEKMVGILKTEKQINRCTKRVEELVLVWKTAY